MTDAPPTPSRPVVGIVGTFDVANFGDLLFPELAAHELERRLGPIELRRYSHRPMAAPPWPYEVRPLDELIGSIGELDLLVVGGGHLIRFDTAVAPGYEAVSPSVPHPGGYWLSPTLMAAAAGVPVAWNAIGASPDTPPWARPLLASALEAVDYVSVRDGDSLAELAAVAGTVPIRLVPDTAFGVRALLEARPRPTLPFEAELEDRPYILIQSSAALRSRAAEIRQALDAIDRADLAVVELPVSPVLGDRIGVLGDLGSGVLQIDPWPDPLTLARIIAGARAVIAHSLHLSIVALAHGVPVFRAGVQPGTKYADLGSFSGVSTIVDGDDLTRALATPAQGSVSTQVQERVSQLTAHWDRIAALYAMRTSEDRARRHLVARRTLALLPAIVADADAHGRDQLAASRAQLDRTVAALDATDDERRALSDRYGATTEKLVDAAHRATELAKQVGALEVEVARERAQGAADRQRSERETAKRRTELAQARAELRDVQHKAAALDRLHRRTSFRAAMAAVRTGRRLSSAIGISEPRRASTDALVKRQATATAKQEQTVRQALLSGAPGSKRTDGPVVSIIILNRDGTEHLRRLLPALERTLYRSFEIIVVDNASSDDSVALLEDSATRLPMKLIRNTENRAFGEANDQAAAVATGDLFLLLNNDVEPLGPGWLGRLVDTLEERDATVVGARLVYPRRPSLDNEGDRSFADLTLQHRGIEFVPADGVPTGRNLGNGTDPASAEAVQVHEVPAVTAACMLVRRDAFVAVGGFTEGYVYGTEDVDLAMKLRAAGGTIIYDGGAVLWHHEYGTQNAQGRDWKRQNRTRNRQRFVDRWGPQAFREVFRDRVLGAGGWSETPLHVAVVLTRDDPMAGFGDYYTAHELGDALAALGWRVSYAERPHDQWYELDPTVDVVVSLLDAFDVRRIPRGVVTIAWVRNWTERWTEHPWFDEYDIVLASSATSRDIIAARTTRWPAVMPLATNPQRFAPRPPTDQLRSDLVFVGSRWGVHRGIEDVLPALADHHVVRVYGRDWDDTALAEFSGGMLDYDRIPDAYASARIVVDDAAASTLPYGSVNSRVFDALAAGALVVSDNESGVRELFGDDFPIAHDAAELEAHLAWAEAEPDAAARLQAQLRDVVLERHTYDHRATEVRDHLLAWADAERYALLVGIPDWDQAPSWGDYHFARDLQRQLERRGHPTRLHLLDEWGRAPAARADVAIHLHGLSDHRPRPSQLNLLWIISHPDRITPQVCDRYDIVFVASDSFATDLAGRVHVPVIPLHQATDPDRFRPDPTGPVVDLLFVANTRGVRRAIVDDLTPTTHELAIYGKGWTPDLVDPVHVRGDHVPNEALHRYYSSARIVLNDHWADMRANGFLSNRLFDALACGAFVISDGTLGIEEEFDGAVVTYTDRDDLRRLVDRYLADPEARRELGDRGRAVVLDRHTFGHRVDRLLEEVAAIGLSRPMRIDEWPAFDTWIDRRRRGLVGVRREPPPEPGLDVDVPTTPRSVASSRR